MPSERHWRHVRALVSRDGEERIQTRAPARIGPCLVSTARKETDARDAIEAAKTCSLNDPRRAKVEKGCWQFVQGRRGARPGESCTAVFWKADRMISISGPGGSCRGALLGFVAIEPPASVTAVNRTSGDGADEIAFAVPTIDAALARVLADGLAFSIGHEGTPVCALEWRSGLAARGAEEVPERGRVEGRELP